MKKLFIIFLCFNIGACASYRPITDMQGVDPAQYERDLAECQRYAEQVSPGGQAVAGAAVGAVLIGAIGGILCGRSCAQQGAAIGAVQGGAVGAADGAGGQIQVIRNCMVNRGYRVLR